MLLFLYEVSIFSAVTRLRTWYLRELKQKPVCRVRKRKAPGFCPGAFKQSKVALEGYLHASNQLTCVIIACTFGIVIAGHEERTQEAEFDVSCVIIGENNIYFVTKICLSSSRNCVIIEPEMGIGTVYRNVIEQIKLAF